MARSVEEMIARWEQIAKGAATYNLVLEDWLNDLDLRDIIERHAADSAFSNVTLRSRLESADRAFREATHESAQSMWGPNAGAAHRADTHWWYFRYPSSPGIEMRRDLHNAGVLSKKP